MTKPRPTHVLIARSDGEKLVGEEWITLEEFAKLFAPVTHTDGRTYEYKTLRVRDEEEHNFEERMIDGMRLPLRVDKEMK